MMSSRSATRRAMAVTGSIQRPDRPRSMAAPTASPARVALLFCRRHAVREPARGAAARRPQCSILCSRSSARRCRPDLCRARPAQRQRHHRDLDERDRSDGRFLHRRSSDITRPLASSWTMEDAVAHALCQPEHRHSADAAAWRPIPIEAFPGTQTAIAAIAGHQDQHPGVCSPSTPMDIGDHWSVVGALPLRSFRRALRSEPSGNASHFTHKDNIGSPRAAVVYKPGRKFERLFLLRHLLQSFGRDLVPGGQRTSGLGPERDHTYEVRRQDQRAGWAAWH